MFPEPVFAAEIQTDVDVNLVKPGAHTMSLQTKFLLDERQMPKYWYNIQADLPQPEIGRAHV